MKAWERIRAVAERELIALFAQPTAWVFLSAFLLVGAGFGLTDFFTRGVADLRDYFSGLRYALVLLAPAASMRLWAAERSTGTIELLFSTPVRPLEAVLGKYLAGLLVIALGLLLGLGLPLSLLPFAEFDLGQVLGGYLGAFLLASAFLAIGCLASALSPSQEVAFLTGAGACLALNVAGDARLIERAAEVFPRELVTTGAAFATGPHYDALTRGLLELRGLIYFGGVSACALFCTTLLVERRGRRGAEPWIAALLALLALGLGIHLANHRSLALRVDLSFRGANSLTPATQVALGGLEGDLVVRAYLSRHRLPESLLPRVREVLDLLEDFEVAGRGKVRLEIVDPTTPELQEAAERQGVKRFQLQVRDAEGGLTLRTVYAGVVLFYEGRPPAAIPVAL
ncbi:MAG: Gldg family protein, partial [Planctomycetes bacterium]|nr:Gldg family protein [Planctomycetota bacterium]